MKIEFHVKDVVITAKQKSLFEKKLAKLKKYIKDEPITLDVYLRDETSVEKGGVDQTVELSALFAGEKIFVQRKDDRMMRAFAYAYQTFEDEMRRIHKKRIEGSQEPGYHRFSKLLKAIKIKK